MKKWSKKKKEMKILLYQMRICGFLIRISKYTSITLVELSGLWSLPIDLCNLFVEEFNFRMHRWKDRIVAQALKVAARGRKKCT